MDEIFITSCEYNAVGRISSVTAANGAKKTYEYNELYLVTKATDAEGVFFEEEYNRDGLLIAEKARPGVNKEYRYDKLGRIVEIKTGGEVTERYSYSAKGRTVTFTDGKGSDYVYSYDEFGRLVSEKNRLDGTQNYTYNDNGELKAKKDFEGNVTEILFDEKTRTESTKYADGSETVIVYDECGNIISATNESGTLSYVYDKAGLLTKETDEKTGETVSYFYDKAGRRTRLVSKERDISYGYGKNGELLTQKDRSKQLSVSYKYDVCGREKERRFGNGVRQLTFYDKAGRTVCIKQINSSDKLLSGEAYVYDKSGRRSLTVNDKGLVTIYKYDNQSRLETVFYPFNEDIKETARKEADKQGLYFLPSQGNAENYFLSSGELMQVRAAAEYIAGGRSGAVTVNQVVWKESYTYDANGNRTSKTTAWGTVAYSYDKENRLVESGDLGKSESVKYTYDKNGNLLRESAARYRKDYVYNMQNRMVFSDVQDSVLNTRNFTEYDYDAFGRRIETRQYLGDYTRNLYDGFSFDIIGKSVLQSAYSANLSEQKYRTPNRQSATSVTGSRTYAGGRNERGTDIGTRYRYIDDNPLVPISEAGNSTNSSASVNGIKTRSRPNNEYVLYSYGEPVAISADGATGYFGTDILGSVRSVTDNYGSVQADYSYDVFGSPYLGNLENDISFGYCGKVYDIGTGLYDYGFRDYSPVSARFTTIDPIRDGSNWFSYVVNDPVNYVDPFGLSATDSRTVKPGDTLGNITWEYNQKHGTHYTAKEIAEFNGIENPDIIYPEQTINFPGGASGATRVAATPTATTQTTVSKTNVVATQPSSPTPAAPKETVQNSLPSWAKPAEQYINTIRLFSETNLNQNQVVIKNATETVKLDINRTKSPVYISAGYGGKLALIIGLGAEGGVIYDTQTNNVYIYISGSIGCGIQTPTVTKDCLSIDDFLNKTTGANIGFTLDPKQVGFSSSLTADICLGVNGTYDLNNLNSSGLPNSWGIGSVGGGVWKTGTFIIPIYRGQEQ
ncbi:MAG: LysM peptidoglycan-binding domain-containing protein [Spirochaetaceae bacterium]|nr:LysM peptidoglycan-binding domain-containing protein [Spirochaetaceae bacterium]